MHSLRPVFAVSAPCSGSTQNKCGIFAKGAPSTSIGFSCEETRRDSFAPIRAFTPTGAFSRIPPHKKNVPSATQKGRSNLLRGTTLIPAGIRRTLNHMRNVHKPSEPTVSVKPEPYSENRKSNQKLRQNLTLVQPCCSGAKVNCCLNTGELSAGDSPSLSENNNLLRKPLTPSPHLYYTRHIPQASLRLRVNPALAHCGGICYGNHFSIKSRNVKTLFTL